MNRTVHFIFSIILITLFFSTKTQGQNVNLDSLKTARKATLDSMRSAQKNRSDSLKTIRTYRESKGFKDSVQNVRLQRTDSLRLERKKITDSLIAVRKKTTDSMVNARQSYNDSVRKELENVRLEQRNRIDSITTLRKKTTDSLAKIRAYRSSKTFKDSVQLVRKHHFDSVKAERKMMTDSIRAVQTARTDSMRAEIKSRNDSMRATLDEMRTIRQHTLDSLTAVRKIRSDSLTKIREEKEVARKAREEAKEKKRKLKFEMEISKKQDSYTNETMRKKGWSLPRKVMQNTVTRYNYYFNANEKMEEAHRNMLQSHIDNYDSLIPLFPFDPNLEAAKLSSDMDSILKTAAVGIQIHDPRGKWQDNLYLLVGEAYYYKGDYENAGSAFKQIIVLAEEEKKAKDKAKNKKVDKDAIISYSEKEKTGVAGIIEHVSSKNEAMLWLVRTLVQSKKEGQAQTILDLLKNDPNFPKSLAGGLALEEANMDLNRLNYKNAIPALSIVSKDKNSPKWLRLRSSFLTAQLLQNQGDLEQSNVYFKEALALHPNLEMNFYARKSLIFNNLELSNNPSSSKDVLKKMLAESKYTPYYDQLYFALAKANSLENKEEAAIENLKLSIVHSKNNKKQKGYSYAALGDAYYQQKQYKIAKNNYDTAIMFLTIDQDPIYSIAQKRAESLNEIVAPSEIVQHQDSLLQLAALSEKDQRTAIRNYIKAYEKALAEKEFLANNQPAGATNNSFNPTAQTWYFSNPTLVQSGMNDFKQNWGDRKLKDNWRRSSNFGGMDLADNNAAVQEKIDPGLDEDSLFAAIPHTPEALAAANKELEAALFLLGKGYYTYLEDYKNALVTFDTLDKRFPDHNAKAEELYLRYLIAMRTNNTNDATQYNNELQTQHPQSEWAKLLQKSGSAPVEETKTNEALTNHYDKTYELLQQRDFTQVLSRIETADKEFKSKGTFEQKYKLLHAIAIAGNGNYELADTLLTDFIKQYPTDSLKDWANQVLTFVRNGGQSATSGNLDTKQPKSIPFAEMPYTYNVASKHYVILVAAADLRLFALKSGLGDYNMMNQGKEEVVVTMTNFTKEDNLLLFKEFENALEAKKYINDLKKNKLLFREYPEKDYKLISISVENYPIFYAKRNFQDYQTFHNKNYK